MDVNKEYRAATLTSVAANIVIAFFGYDYDAAWEIAEAVFPEGPAPELSIREIALQVKNHLEEFAGPNHPINTTIPLS